MFKNKFILVSIPTILIAVGVFYLTSLFIKPSPKKLITIATGSVNGEYYQTALKYKQILKKQKVKVNIVTTSGSLENLELLEKKKVDIAFIQNGIIQKTPDIQALASIYYEPLLVFYRNLKKADYITDFQKKQISIGSKKSGTYYLAKEILKTNELDKTDIKLLNYSATEATKLIKNDDLDAIFLVSSLNSKIVLDLLNNENLSLLSFKRAKAYSRRFNYLESITLYEGTINLNKNIPNENKELLATTALLVSHKDFSDELIRILMKSVKKVHSKKSLFSQEDEFPNLKNISIPINDEAQRYLKYGDSFLEKIFPYWIASNLDRLKILLIPLLTLLFPIFKGALPLYRWNIRSKIYRWYDELQDLDIQLESIKDDDYTKSLRELEKLKKEIKDETKVPLSYMREYYDLIMHIELIISKVHKKIESK